MFSQAVSQTVGVESGSAGGCVSASFSVAGGVAGGTFEEGGAFCRGFSCEREGAGGLDMGEGCAGASVSSSKDACRASLMAEETAVSFCRDARIGGGCGLWASSGKAAAAAALSVGRGDSVPRLLLSRFMTWAVLLVLEPFTEAI